MSMGNLRGRKAWRRLERHPKTAVEEAQQSQQSPFVRDAARLAAKSGPVAWNPIASTPAAEKAMREGDAAVGRVVSALGQKEFVEAFEALEAARDAFMRAGPEVETARSQTIDNLYGYIRAETERNEKLARLVRLKEVLKKKADLKLQDELDERRAGGFES